ncbi:MAG: metallophosphoesterase [Saprospiraceae bacterium]
MNIIFLSFLVGIFFLIDLYIFQGFKTIYGNHPETVYAIWMPRIFWIVNAGFYVLLLSSILTINRDKGMQTLQVITINTFIALMIPKLIFMGFMWVEDLARLAQGSYSAIFANSDDDFMPSRRAFISKVALGAAAIPFAAIVYGILKGKYDYTVRRHSLYFKDLPDAFDGFTITQLSDFHAGSFDNQEAVRKGLELANQQQSDLFVFTGDLVNNEAGEVLPYLPYFNSISAPYGKFSILGNHDYGDYKSWSSIEEKRNNLLQLFEHHQTMGFRLLRNEHMKIEKDGQAIHLVGVENWGHGFSKYGDFEKAIDGAPKDSFKILLSHDPTHWEKEVKKHNTHIHLTLAGHTHGAQMGVELGNFKWSPIQYRYAKWAGIYKEFEKYLHINRGFGFLAFSGRVGILPEITVLTLRQWTIDN